MPKAEEITIYDDRVEFRNNNFVITTRPVPGRDIDGCIARAQSHASNANIKGITMRDLRGQGGGPPE